MDNAPSVTVRWVSYVLRAASVLKGCVVRFGG